MAQPTHDCDICGRPEFETSLKRHRVDHCRTTNAIRGILCQGCNLHLGRWESRGLGISVDHDHDKMAVVGLLCISCNVTEGWYEKNGPSVEAYLKNGAPKGV